MPIYIAQVEGDETAIKLGHSLDVPKRINMLQGAHYRTVRCVRVLNGTIEDERELKRRFAHLCLRNEWFKAHPDFLGDLGFDDLPIPPLKYVRVPGAGYPEEHCRAIAEGHLRNKPFRQSRQRQHEAA